MRHTTRAMMLGSLALLTLGLYGCPKSSDSGSSSGDAKGGGSSSTTKPNAEASGGSKIRIAVIPKGTAHSFWKGMEAGALKAGEEEGVEVIWKGPDRENDITSQVNLVQNQSNNNVQGVVLAATDATALVKPIKDLTSKGIAVVTVDSGVKEDVSACYIATDNVKGGSLGAEELAKAIGNKGKVGLLLFLKGAVSNDEREKGFKEGLKKFPDIQIVSELYASSPSEALNVTTNMLTSNPDIVGIFAANEPNGVGAANYLRQTKKTGKIKLVAYDTSPEEVKALDEGIIQSLIVQNPYEMGYQGVKTALKVIKKQALEKKFIDSGVVVVTKENKDKPDVQKLLTVPTK